MVVGHHVGRALTGRLPARDKDGNPERPENLPPPFDGIVKGCLTPGRESRLYIPAIRNLLARPVIEAVAEGKPVAKPEAASPLDVGPAPVYGSTRARAGSFSQDKSAKGSALAGKQPFVLAAVALFVILAIAIGLRLVRNSSET